jgi:hypothetical protein
MTFLGGCRKHNNFDCIRLFAALLARCRPWPTYYFIQWTYPTRFDVCVCELRYWIFRRALVFWTSLGKPRSACGAPGSCYSRRLSWFMQEGYHLSPADVWCPPDRQLPDRLFSRRAAPTSRCATAGSVAPAGCNFPRTIPGFARVHDELRIVADQIDAPTRPPRSTRRWWPLLQPLARSARRGSSCRARSI